MAYAAKESQDAAIRHMRLARIQRVAGFPDLAEAEEQTATGLIQKGNEDAEKRGEHWEEARKRKLENLSRLLLNIDDTRVQVSKDQQTKEINLTNEGIQYDEDTKELLNIGRSGFPPLKMVHQTGITEEGEIVFPIEDSMVLVEKYINQEMRPLKRERVIRIMNESDASQMQRKIFDHISNIGSNPTTG